jgi:hypothetical protein
MCGSSSGQKGISADQANFYNTLQQSYATEFAGQSAILNSLNSVFTPILNAGPNQRGMSASESASLNTGAMDRVSGNYQNAARAVGEQMAARGGGAANLTSGATGAVQGNIAAQGAGELSREQLGINEQDYALGREQFNQAAGALSGVARTFDPSGFAGQATGAGTTAFNSATQMYSQGKQWVGALGGALGGAVSTVSGGLAGSLGTELSTLGSGNIGW